jgi:hypothetical protein
MTRSFLKLAAAILVGSVITGQAQADEWYFPSKTPYAVPVAQKPTETLPAQRRGKYTGRYTIRKSGAPSRYCSYRGGPKSNGWDCSF